MMTSDKELLFIFHVPARNRNAAEAVRVICCALAEGEGAVTRVPRAKIALRNFSRNFKAALISKRALRSKFRTAASILRLPF